jgi:hypothetical protein
MRLAMLAGLLIVTIIAGCTDKIAQDDVPETEIEQPEDRSAETSQTDTSEIENIINKQMLSEEEYVEIGEMI